MEKFMHIMGLLPQWTGSEPGVANIAITGSAGTAEGSTRLAGGVASTAVTHAYTNNRASAYAAEQRSRQSLFSRYASLDNPDSLAAKSMFAISTTSFQKSFRFLGRMFVSLPATFGNIISGRLFAANDGPDAASYAKWAGVDTYDIPQACIDLDPLDSNYLTKAVGVEASSPYAAQATEVMNNIQPDITKETARDETTFWGTVYDNIDKEGEEAENIAGAIYNCALFDRQVEGSLGYLYGYTDDGGLGN
jgi:hypothetical protein